METNHTPDLSFLTNARDKQIERHRLEAEELKKFDLFDSETGEKITVEVTHVSGYEFKALCPKHDDHNPSLFINLEKEVFNCQGCGWKGKLWDDGKSKPDSNGDKPKGEINITYDYLSPEGVLLYQTVRMIPKDFRQRKPNGLEWVWNIKGVQKVLYRLPELIESDDPTVFIVEGEKDTDRLRELGFTVTTNPMGGGNWESSYNKYLKDKDVIIIGDNDEKGKIHVNKVGQNLKGVVKSLRVLDLKDVWEDIPDKGDISDLLELCPMTKEEFEVLLSKTKEWKDELTSTLESLPSANDIASMDIHVEELVENLIPVRMVTLLYGRGGTHKTRSMLGLSVSVSRGDTQWFDRKILGKLPVLYVDYQNPLETIQGYLKEIMGNNLNVPDLKVWHGHHTPRPKRLDDTKEWEIYKKYPPGLIIFDTLRGAQSLDTLSTKDMALIMNRLKELRDLGFTVILLHNTNKGSDEDFTGSMTIYDESDHILLMKRVKDLKSDEEVKDGGEQSWKLPLKLCYKDKTRTNKIPKDMFFKYETGTGLYVIQDPKEKQKEELMDILVDIRDRILSKLPESPTQKEFIQAIVDGTSWDEGKSPGAKIKVALRWIKSGCDKTWTEKDGITDDGKKCKTYTPKGWKS